MNCNRWHVTGDKTVGDDVRSLGPACHSSLVTRQACRAEAQRRRASPNTCHTLKNRARREEAFAAEAEVDPSLVTPAPANSRAFTLLELLMVIAILGILAGLTIPVLKHFGRSDASLSGSRQLLDDVGRARQLAMSQRTTVYMVFVPPMFWQSPPQNLYNSSAILSAWQTSMTSAQQVLITNLCDKQFTGYTFLANGALGDQPGQHQWHYLAPWQVLPQGTFIATNKFGLPGTLLSSVSAPLYSFWNSDYPHPDQNRVYTFTNLVAVPFPTATNNPLYFPAIAFNYQGQLTLDGVNPATRDEYIPIANGSVVDAKDVNKMFVLGLPDAEEVPPGNSTNITYNIVHIDALTGRAVLEFHKVQ